MRTSMGWIAVLLVVAVGIAAAAENNSVPLTAEGKCCNARPDPTVRLMLADAASKIITPEIVRKINDALTNTCVPSENPSIETRKAFLGGLSPSAAVVGLLKYDYGIEAAGVVKAVITQQPAHGKIAMIGLATQSFPGLSLEEFQYTPDKDFLGEDKVVFEVTVNGQKFRVSSLIKVVHGTFDDVCVPPGADSGSLTTDIQITAG